MRNYCPECETDIFQELYDEFIDRIDFNKEYDFECPACGCKLVVSMDWDFVVNEGSENE